MILITTHIDAERLAGSKSVSLVCSSFGFGDMAAFMKNGKMERLDGKHCIIQWNAGMGNTDTLRGGASSCVMVRLHARVRL